MSKDLQGREYAKTKEIHAGSKVETDDGFTCISKGEKPTVYSAPDGLFFICDEGRHYLSGQIEEDYYKGLYHVY